MKRMLFFLVLVAAVLFMSGCTGPTTAAGDADRPGQADAVTPEKSGRFEYHPDTEVPEGPGIFTGESGEFKILDR
ncbi:MAG: hypothetical protein Kow0089_07800 [Desulfobulbaceae bacterium]